MPDVEFKKHPSGLHYWDPRESKTGNVFASLEMEEDVLGLASHSATSYVAFAFAPNVVSDFRMVWRCFSILDLVASNHPVKCLL